MTACVANVWQDDTQRPLCGAYFVPTQDHEALPPCPTCQERFGALPGKERADELDDSID
jgi:Protein of unknown function (DUF3039)